MIYPPSIPVYPVVLSYIGRSASRRLVCKKTFSINIAGEYSGPPFSFLNTIIIYNSNNRYNILLPVFFF